MMPKIHVALAGVRYFGLIRPYQPGNARWTAIESSLRAAGRIVVWVDAAAELSTAMISTLSNGDPSTRLPVALEDVVAVRGEERRAPSPPAPRWRR